MENPAFAELAVIVRGADNAALYLAPQAAGLLAISLGLSHNFRDDHEQLKHGFDLRCALRVGPVCSLSDAYLEPARNPVTAQ